MKPSDVEAWASRVIDSLRRSTYKEDSRVELKAEWIPADKAARRIAGHLNAAGGEDLLWLVGVDESGGITEVAPEDFSGWWSSVLACFDGPLPSATEVVLEDGGSFVAIGLSGPQRPYVVKNPKFGEAGGGPVSLEVPWREMTSTRSARHLDLLRILVPQARLPEIEVLRAFLIVEGPHDPVTGLTAPTLPEEPCTWHCEIELYCVPADAQPLVFPNHQISVLLQQAETVGEIPLRSRSPQPSHPGFHLHGGDHVRHGPGDLRIVAFAYVEKHSGTPAGPAVVRVQIRPALISQVFRLDCHFELVDGVVFRFQRSDQSWQHIATS